MATEPRIDIIGISADGLASLRPEVADRIRSAKFLAGGERHLGLVPSARGERFVLRDNVTALLARLGDRLRQGQSSVVLASGDPLLYGIGIAITDTFNVGGARPVRVEPALSSMQLAFARLGVSWQYAVLASVHGRDLRPVLLPLLGKGLIGLFTEDGDGPAAVAQFFLERGLDDYAAFVGENLGGADERLSRWANLRELAQQRFAPLNYLILRRTRKAFVPAPVAGGQRAEPPGISDEAFLRPDTGPEVMTRQEVRAVLVSKLPRMEAGDVAWEIGAGLGTVTVEIALARPHVDVFALERDERRFGFLQQNLARFAVYNVRAVRAEAPEGLRELPEKPSPGLVFIGGSGGRLAEILDVVSQALLPGGKFLADFVALENLNRTLEHLRRLNWPVQVTELNVARSDQLAALTTLKPMRGVFIVEATKPGAAYD